MARFRFPLFTSLLAAALALPLAAAPVLGTDTTPPRALDWGPRGANVPTDTQILISWSERMDWASIETAFSYSDGASTYSSGGWIHDGARNTSVFSPAAPLAPETHYVVRVNSTASDPAGNRLDQNNDGVGGGPCVGPVSSWDCLEWSFDTAPPPPDTTPPRVVSTSPPRGGLATTDAPLHVVFSEAMDTASVEAALGYGDGYSLYTIADGTATWTATSLPDDTLRFSPRLEFSSGGSVTVVLSGLARDVAGNALDGDGDGQPGDPYAWSFVIQEDPTPPRILESDPAADAVDVPISASIRVTFSKSMGRSSVEGAIRLSTTSGPNLTGLDGYAVWSGSRFPADTLVWNPVGNLRTSEAYTFSVNGSLAVDREGRFLDGNGNGTSEGAPADDARIPFTTEAQDLRAPVVLERSPPSGATEVLATARIGVRFSEPMDRESVAAALRYTDGASVYGSADGTVSWNLTRDEFLFTPATALRYGTRYTVTLDGVVARDEAGNPLNGGQNETWSFTTAGQPDTTPPQILWRSPINGQKNVSRTARISFIFNEPMDKASVQDAIQITGGTSLTDFRWPNDATVEAATSTPLAYRTGYTVFVLTSATDLAGNSLPQPEQITFTTESWRGPVTGRVVDEAGVAVRGARVQLNGLSVLTNEAGDFAFETVEQGPYTLMVSHPEFETHTESGMIEPGQGSLGTITLRRPTAATVDAAIWAAVGAALLFVLLLIVFLRRRRPKPAAHYETWRPAKVVTVEPGKIRHREEG